MSKYGNGLYLIDCASNLFLYIFLFILMKDNGGAELNAELKKLATAMKLITKGGMASTVMN